MFWLSLFPFLSSEFMFNLLSPPLKMNLTSLNSPPFGKTFYKHILKIDLDARYPFYLDSTFIYLRQFIILNNCH